MLQHISKNVFHTLGMPDPFSDGMPALREGGTEFLLFPQGLVLFEELQKYPFSEIDRRGQGVCEFGRTSLVRRVWPRSGLELLSIRCADDRRDLEYKLAVESTGVVLFNMQIEGAPLYQGKVSPPAVYNFVNTVVRTLEIERDSFWRR